MIDSKSTPEVLRPLPLAAWLPVAIMAAISLISYLDRTTLAVLAPTILGETRFTAQQFFLINSAFSAAYTIGNFSWGYLIDRFGLRMTVTASVLMWSLASAYHALLATFSGFVVARIVLGFAEGATFPAGLLLPIAAVRLGQS
jgi:MFS transporter, ACS family, hexuronate transporter